MDVLDPLCTYKLSRNKKAHPEVIMLSEVSQTFLSARVERTSTV